MLSYLKRLCPLLAMLLVAATSHAQTVLTAPPDPYVHIATNIAFPETVGNFERRHVIVYDSEGLDSSVNYQSTELESPTRFSIYVYPKQSSCDRAFEDTVEQVAGYEGEQVEVESEPSNIDGFAAAQQYFVAYTIPAQTLAPQQPELISEAWLMCFPDKEWLVKLRVSYEARHVKEAEGLSAELIRQIDWSPLTAP